MKLYKYYEIKRGLHCLTENRLYFTPPKFFNDPFEFLPAARGVLSNEQIAAYLRRKGHREALRRVLQNVGRYSGTRRHFRAWLEDNLETLLSEIGERFRETSGELQKTFYDIASRFVGVCTLSAVSSDLLMWAHYANSHRGIVLGYDFQRDSQRDDFPFDVPEPVRYSANRVVVEPVFFGTLRPYEKAVVATMLTKSLHWKYEREYRLIRDLDLCQKETVADRQYYFDSYPSEMTVEAILGARSTAEDLRILQQQAERRPTLQLYIAKLDPHGFSLNVERIAEARHGPPAGEVT